jgi:hypothetical protein
MASSTPPLIFQTVAPSARFPMIPMSTPLRLPRRLLLFPCFTFNVPPVPTLPCFPLFPPLNATFPRFYILSNIPSVPRRTHGSPNVQSVPPLPCTFPYFQLISPGWFNVPSVPRLLECSLLFPIRRFPDVPPVPPTFLPFLRFPEPSLGSHRLLELYSVSGRYPGSSSVASSPRHSPTFPGSLTFPAGCKACLGTGRNNKLASCLDLTCLSMLSFRFWSVLGTYAESAPEQGDPRAGGNPKRTRYSDSASPKTPERTKSLLNSVYKAEY